MNLKMHGFYDKIIDHAYIAGEPFIECYDDSAVSQCDTYLYKSIALMIEPRTISARGYNFLENGGWKCFQYVFTHDSKLLEKLPNAKPILVAAVWCESYKPKSKNISLVCSFKSMCELHRVRKNLAWLYENDRKVDVYGDWQSETYQGWVEPLEYLEDYRYSIIIENYIDDIYFTEKILNCFANKVVPIYLGARNIDKYFNKYGIIKADRWQDIPLIVNNLYKLGIEEDYKARKQYIEENYEKSRQFTRFEDWFFREYGEMLDDLGQGEI